MTGAVATTRKAIAVAEGLAARDPTDMRSARDRLATSLQRTATILPDDDSARAAARR